MRLIDADVPRKQIVDWLNWYTGSEAVKCAVQEVLETFGEAPTIDAEPVRHGRWIREDAFSSMIDEPWLCSGCNLRLVLNRLDTPHNRGYYHCPNCGAKMDGGAADA